MVIALTHARPDELPGLLAHILTVPKSDGQLVDIAKYLAPCGRVQMLLSGVMHLVPLPAKP